VHFCGRVSNLALPRLLSELDIFALASKFEGLPVALLEARACERACVATRCGGPEAVIRDGQDGFLVDAGEAAGLAGRMDLLAWDAELRRKLGSAARTRVVDRFNAQAQGLQYGALYRELAGMA